MLGAPPPLISSASVSTVIRHAAALSSLPPPRITNVTASSGNGRCNALASSHDARIQTSRSSSVIRITDIAFGWIGSMMAFGSSKAEVKPLCARTTRRALIQKHCRSTFRRAIKARYCWPQPAKPEKPKVETSRPGWLGG